MEGSDDHLEAFETKLTRQTGSEHHVTSVSELKLQLQLQLILKTEYLHSLCQTSVLGVGVHLHIEQKWKIKNIHVCALQLSQPRPA